MRSRMVAGKMYIKLHNVVASRLGFSLIVLLTFTLLLVQWQFHTFTSVINQERSPKDLKDTNLWMNPTDLIIQKLQGDHKTSEKVIESLNNQIEDLQQILKVKMEQLANMRRMQEANGKISSNDLTLAGIYPDADKVSYYVKSQVENAFVLRPHQYKNEYDISPFTTFTRTSIFNLNIELVRQPEKVLNFHEDKSKDLKEVIDAGTQIVNNGDVDVEFEFVEGLYRLQYKAGMQYELSYRSKLNTSAPLRIVTLFRPFAPIHLVSNVMQPSEETVHVVVPLQGRGDAFMKFMENFKTMAILSDGHVFLTVVCFGDEALIEAKTVLEQVQEDTGFSSFQIVAGQSGSFARGRALQEGVMALSGTNPLMFFCDVDMFFTTHFLTQCRSHTKPGSKVFYPVVFSLYNPEIVYVDKSTPPMRDQQVVRSENGFWRDFGFGMTCQYKQDFNDIGGFDLTIKGWGSEDVLLYRKYTRSTKYQVIRTPVNTLFHHWHPKHCDKSLSLEQYNACLRSRSLTEGSQIQLGMLYLREKDNN